MATEQVGMTASGVPTAPRDGGGSWLVVLAMAVPLLMLTIDAFGLTVALPAIGHALDTSTTTLAWVLNAFLFAFAAPQIAAGRLADTFGRRRVVLLGLITFIVGSVAAGIAQSIAWLIAARALQGFGTALSFVASLAIVSNAFPPAQRGQAIGIWAAAGTIGQALSPLVVGSVLAGLASLALFLWLEPRVRTPLVEFALFKNRTFMGTLLVHFSWNWVWSVFMFLLTLYLQHVRDLSPLQTGVLYLGFALPFVIGSSVAGKVGARVGERVQ